MAAGFNALRTGKMLLYDCIKIYHWREHERACLQHLKKSKKTHQKKSIPKVKVKSKSNQKVSESQKKSQFAQIRLFFEMSFFFWGGDFFFVFLFYFLFRLF